MLFTSILTAVFWFLNPFYWVVNAKLVLMQFIL